jgi:hypothetical protein
MTKAQPSAVGQVFIIDPDVPFPRALWAWQPVTIEGFPVLVEGKRQGP